MSKCNLEELYELVIDNDNEAIDELIDRFKPLIYNNSYIDGELDLDCVQELNIKLYNCVRKFKFKSKYQIKEYLSVEQLF